jgi:hypothetical protein
VFKADVSGLSTVQLLGWQPFAQGNQSTWEGPNSCQLGSEITPATNITAYLLEKNKH